MDSVLESFGRIAGEIGFRAPALPLISNVTGRPLERAPDAAYWCRHLREGVRFADGMAALDALGHALFLEVGPGTTLIGLGQRCLPGAARTWVALLEGVVREHPTQWFNFFDVWRPFGEPIPRSAPGPSPGPVPEQRP